MPRSPQRSSPENARDPALDGLRGLAILLVYLFHYGGGLRAHNPIFRVAGYLTEAGWVGVDIFFALSGFLITGLLADNLRTPHALPNFYARRALRILPLYFAALLACAVAALATGTHLPQLRPLLVYLGFLQNIPGLLQRALQAPPPLPLHHLWSLAVEEQFYLVWPLCLLLAATERRALTLCLWIFALSCCFRFTLWGTGIFSDATLDSFAVILPARAGALALGAALAIYLRLHPGIRLLRPATLIAVIALAVWLATALLTHTFLLTNRLAFTVGFPAIDLLSAALVALSLQPNALRSALSHPALGFLGRISYGFYVLHILLEPLFDHLGSALTHATSGFAYQTARFLLAFPITLAAAWLSFTFFERPFLQLKRRFPRRSQTLQTEAVANPATP